MTPFFNSGVIYSLWSTGLAEKWAAHSTAIFNAFRDTPDVPQSFSTCLDQVAFATAVQELREKIPFRFLPDHYNAIRPVLARGAIELSDVVLLHAVGFLAGADNCARIPQEVRDYEKIMTRILRRRPKLDSQATVASNMTSVRPRKNRQAAEFRRRLRRLYRTYVEPLVTRDAP